MPEATLNKRSVYYEIHGQGAPVILLHHGFGCVKMWKDIVPPLVDAGYMVVMYDRRGFGRSDGGPDFMDFYMSDRYRPESVDELGGLATYLGLDAFHLIGQCEGGAVALQFAARYPNRVGSVITSSTLCHSDRTMEEFNREKFPKAFPELAPDLRDKLIDWHGPDNAEPFYEQFRWYGGAYGRDVFDIRPILALVTQPSLVIYPDRSALFDVEQGVDMYRGLARGELAVLPRCGHNTYEYQPDEYARLAVRFLDRQRNGETAAFDPTKVCVG
jgi:pimeloyl-ACP methyl ester carboxylesterase